MKADEPLRVQLKVELRSATGSPRGQFSARILKTMSELALIFLFFLATPDISDQGFGVSSELFWNQGLSPLKSSQFSHAVDLPGLWISREPGKFQDGRCCWEQNAGLTTRCFIQLAWTEKKQEFQHMAGSLAGLKRGVRQSHGR